MATFQAYAMDLIPPFQQGKRRLYLGNNTRDTVSDVDGRPEIFIVCVCVCCVPFCLHFTA